MENIFTRLGPENEYCSNIDIFSRFVFADSFTRDIEKMLMQDFAERTADDIPAEAPKRVRLSSDDMDRMFSYTYESISKRACGWTVFAYTKENFPILYAHNAHLPLIAADGDNVVFMPENSCSAWDWDEMLEYMAFSADSIGINFHRGLKKAFVLVTDTETVQNVLHLFDDVRAGLLIDGEKKRLTVLDPISAVFAFHELFGFCSEARRIFDKNCCEWKQAGDNAKAFAAVFDKYSEDGFDLYKDGISKWHGDHRK